LFLVSILTMVELSITALAASLMIGDSMSDVNAARAAKFSIICMSYGYNHGEDIRDYDPDAVIDTMTEIKDLIDW